MLRHRRLHEVARGDPAFDGVLTIAATTQAGRNFGGVARSLEPYRVIRERPPRPIDGEACFVLT